MNRRYKLIFSNPISQSHGVKKDDWLNIKYQFTPNYPANLAEESDIASKLEGVVSEETKLKVLSIVDNVSEEIGRMKKEQDKIGNDAVMNRMFSSGGNSQSVAQTDLRVQGKQLNGAQTQSLIAIMDQYTSGAISEGQAVNLIATAIGITKDEARQILNGEL